LLVEKDEAVVAGMERGEEVGEFVCGEDVGGSRDVRRERLQGGAGVEGDADAREGVDAIEKGRVEGEAEFGERTELRGIVGVVGGEHSGGCGGGFGERSGAVEHGDAETAVVEFESERKADDTGSGDTDVGVLHKISLVCLPRGYSLGVRFCVRRGAVVMLRAGCCVERVQEDKRRRTSAGAVSMWREQVVKRVRAVSGLEAKRKSKEGRVL
jgi:hypothetical protein